MNSQRQKVTHVIWDWNGTLLDDTAACLGALNRMLVRRGRGTITLEYFREHFAFPARNFYRELGMEVPDSEWKALATEYIRDYAAEPQRLNPEAVTTLEQIAAAGIRQSVLSALREDLLKAALRRYGIDQFFERVYGVDNLDGASKLERGWELLADMERAAAPVDPGEFRRGIVMVGDAIHDLEVAEQLGVRCLLCAQGSHSFARLAAVAPTVNRLAEVASTLTQPSRL